RSLHSFPTRRSSDLNNRFAEIDYRRTESWVSRCPMQLGAFHKSAIHPGNNFVVRVIEHADMVRAFDREEFHERKFMRELASHSNWNHFVLRAVKNCDARIRVES